MKKLLLTIVAIMGVMFIACCVFEASYDLAKIFGIDHRWFDCLSVCIFFGCFLLSVPLKQGWEEMRAKGRK